MKLRVFLFLALFFSSFSVFAFSTWWQSSLYYCSDDAVIMWGGGMETEWGWAKDYSSPSHPYDGTMCILKPTPVVCTSSLVRDSDVKSSTYNTCISQYNLAGCAQGGIIVDTDVSTTVIEGQSTPTASRGTKTGKVDLSKVAAGAAAGGAFGGLAGAAIGAIATLGAAYIEAEYGKPPTINNNCEITFGDQNNTVISAPVHEQALKQSTSSQLKAVLDYLTESQFDCAIGFRCTDSHMCGPNEHFDSVLGYCISNITGADSAGVCPDGKSKVDGVCTAASTSTTPSQSTSTSTSTTSPDGVTTTTTKTTGCTAGDACDQSLIRKNTTDISTNTKSIDTTTKSIDKTLTDAFTDTGGDTSTTSLDDALKNAEDALLNDVTNKLGDNSGALELFAGSLALFAPMYALIPDVSNECKAFVLPIRNLKFSSSSTQTISFDFSISLCPLIAARAILEWVIYALTALYVFNVSLDIALSKE